MDTSKKSISPKKVTKNKDITKKNKKEIKLKGILKSPHWKSNKKKHIYFNKIVNVREFVKDENEKNCVINPLPQLLFKQLNIAHSRIFNIINKFSINKILQCVGIDEPIKIFDNRIGWWKDRSAILLLNKMKDKNFLQQFITRFDNKIKITHNIGEMKGCIMNYGRFTIKCYKVIRVH